MIYSLQILCESGVIPMDNKDIDTLTVKLNCEGIDDAIEKLSRLNELLKETITLIDSIKN